MPRTPTLPKALLLAATLLVAAPAGAGAAPANEWCPLKPDRPAMAKYRSAYKGRPVDFCCADCVETFQADPQAYVSRVPQLAEQESHASGGGGRLPKVFGAKTVKRLWRASRNIWATGPLPYVLLGILIVHFAAGRAARRLNGHRGGRLLASLGRPLVVLLLVQGAVLAYLAWGYVVAVETGTIDAPRASAGSPTVGYVTDFIRQASVQDREAASRMAVTYYRGNDERSDAMFNGGRYRTCTFHIALVDDQDRPVRPGDVVQGRTIVVRLQIDRAPYTSDSFFANLTDEYALTRRAVRPWLDAPPLPVQTSLEEVVPARQWVARHPIGPMGAGHVEDGVVLVAPVNQDGDAQHQAAHYGIYFEIRTDPEGRLTPGSKLWMASLLPGPATDGEEQWLWFGERPIPELPGPNTTNPALLGVDQLHRQRAARHRGAPANE